ncbi:MAG: hypothetical protein ACYC0J_09825, partial [Gammaproteobacteria bacterium]
MNNNDNQQKSDDGLPEVSQKMTRKKSALVMMGALLMIAIGMLFQSKSPEKSDKPIEETYSVQNESDNKTVIPIPPLDK